MRIFSTADRDEIGGQLEKWASFVLANILWGIVSLPLITLPAATAGLFAVMSKRARGEPVELFSAFFEAMRRYGLKATVMGLVTVVAVGFVLLNLAIVGQMGGDPVAWLARSLTVFAGVMFLLASLYAWSLLVVVEMPLITLAKAAVQLVFAYPLWSVGVLLAACVPAVVSVLLPMGVFMLGTASATVLIITAGTWRVMRRHLSESDL